MVELAEIFRQHGAEYQSKYGGRMLPSHLRAMQDIQRCRTEALGGQVYYCKKCDQERYSYHSCKNRHCPKCQNDQAEQWLQTQKALLLPVTHFMVTFTLPEELRAVARSHHKTVYNILFRASSQALQKLAWDERFVGGRIGMVGVLHTWTRALRYHPHVHYIVAGGALTRDGRWVSSRPDFLVHVEPLGVIFRAKVRDELKKAGLFAQVHKRVWKKQWVVHSEPVGSGQTAFRYLAPYIFRVAISNNRILKLTDGKVTFQYKESATDQVRFCTVSAEEFIRRFLQHVLPRRFAKVRYYGLLAPSHRHWLSRARQLLRAEEIKRNSTGQGPAVEDANVKVPTDAPRCPQCGSELKLIRTVMRRSRPPP